MLNKCADKVSPETQKISRKTPENCIEGEAFQSHLSQDPYDVTLVG